MRFCTAINCMDGRVQLPVIEYVQAHFDAEHVDVISDPGPNRILAEGTDLASVQSIERRLRISVEKHRSVGIAVAGHFDCAGNPANEEEQKKHTLAAMRYVQNKFPAVPVIGLWVGETWAVSRVDD